MPTLTLEAPQVVQLVKPSLEEWKQEGQAMWQYYEGVRSANETLVGNITRLAWKIGDWLMVGETEFKQQAIEEAMRITGRSQSTIWDFLRVARAFQVHSRRRESLSWSHHKEVAVTGLTPETQDRLLDSAAMNKLSVQKLRVKVEREKKGADDRDYTPREEKAYKVLKVSIPAKSLKWINKLAAARRRSGGELLYRIAADYFRDHKEELEAEIEKYEAPLRKFRAERMSEAKQKKANMNPRLAEPRWREIQKRMGELTRSIASQTGERGQYIFDYLQAECGTRDPYAVPIEVFDKLLATVDAVEDVPGKLHIIKQLANKPKSLPEITLKPR
jgi:hypothetical protein